MSSSQNNIRPLFCFDVTTNKKNDVLSGGEFITRTASKERMEEYENKRENLEQTVEKSQLPGWLKIIKLLLGYFAVIILLGTIKAGLETASKNAPGLITAGVACGILWMILYIVSKTKENQTLKEEDAEGKLEELKGDFLSIQDELNVPKDAVEIDVLSFRYKRKNGEIRPCTVGMQMTVYFNAIVKIYATPDELHVVDLENVYSFPKSTIKSIITVNKRISVPVWNKEEAPTKGKFKPYKMALNGYGHVFFKPYHILEIEKDGERFGVYFPCYELDTIENLTGLTASCG